MNTADNDLNFLDHLIRHPSRHGGLTAYLKTNFDAVGIFMDKNVFADRMTSLLSSSVLPEEIKFLIRLNLLTRVLIHKYQIPGSTRRWFYNWINAEAMLHNAGEMIYHPSEWIAVPVIVADNEHGEIRFFIVGAEPASQTDVQWPPWAGKLMDERSQNALKLAASVAGSRSSHRFYVYTPARPTGSVQIFGASLGLPLALGFKCLIHGRTFPPGLLATGIVQADGTINAVDLLKKKFNRCLEKKATVIYPSRNATDPIEIDHLRVLPAETFDEAWMFGRLFEADRAQELVTLSRMLRDPVFFAGNFSHIETGWLRWAKKNKKLSSIFEQMVFMPECFVDFVNNFKRLVERFDNEKASIVGSIFTPAETERIAEKAPLSTFQFCLANLSLANHKGRIRLADRWVATAEKLLPRIKPASVEAMVDYFNHYFVSRHNRYAFDPQLPKMLLDILDLMESQYRLQCEFGCPTQPGLGRLYGTITQNYGFCGPAYLKKTEHWCRKARKALGQNTVPEFQTQWIRQFNYLIYAYLDAGIERYPDAERTLLRYLGISNRFQIMPGLEKRSEWELALCARFIADTGTPAEKSGFTARADVLYGQKKKTQHPWQLLTYNVGRMALATGDQARAVFWFSESLQLCNAIDMGSTVKIMALLPLAGLKILDAMDNARMKNAQTSENLTWESYKKLINPY